MRCNGSDVRGARSPQAVAVRVGQRPVLCRNRCRVPGATARRSWRKWRAGDRRCGRDCRLRKGFSRDGPAARRLAFSTVLAGSRARRLLAQPVTGRRLAAVRTVQPQAPLQLCHPRQKSSVLAAQRIVLCRKRRHFPCQHRILGDKSFNARLQDCNRSRIASHIRRLLWNTERRLGRCHRRV